jgi:hypothetical protein
MWGSPAYLASVEDANTRADYYAELAALEGLDPAHERACDEAAEREGEK